MKRDTFVAAGFCVGLLMVMASFPLHGLQEEDNTALLKKISGTWEFVAGYDVLQVEFIVEDGILRGTEVGSEEMVDCEQDENNPMIFRGFTPDGDSFEIEFFKDEEGNISKAKLVIDLAEAEGVKIKAG